MSGRAGGKKTCEPMCMWRWDSELDKSLLALFRKWRRFSRGVRTEEYMKHLELKDFCRDMEIALEQLAPVDGIPYRRNERVTA